MNNLRSPEQKYVFNMWESPYHTHADLNNLAQQNFFNLTMTYRLDSDIYSPYGRFYKLNKPVPEREIMSAVSGKTRLAAQFVTNCNTPSKREQLVAELQKFISVDVYGSCGPLKCERKIQNECNSKLESTYYFYLAFENSICLDYVTEKFFSRVEVAVVPVVLLRSNYEAIAPKKSFIAVSDFLSVKSLADYLVYLSKNHTAYGEYLSWRQHYTTKQSSLLHTDKSHGFCGLCKALHDPRVISRNKVYPDMKQFWKNMANCNTDIVDTLLSDSKLPH